ncbi:MAG: autotransporter-associated beta strand repeat-containing protein, partial [Akkermansiaceae bacterium]|nr:autotransporter-associated beta strand repeat-containing protein [Akkermansiaceae bacterium]
TLTGSNTGDLILHQFNTGGNLTIASIIANNTGATGVTKTGAGTVILSGASTYTGTTRVFEGTLRVTGNNGAKLYEVGSQGRLEIGYGIGQVYGYGVTVNGNGLSSTNGLALEGGRTYTFQSAIRLAGAPTTVRSYGTGNATLGGYDSNGTHLVVESSASGSAIASTVNYAGLSFGYVMNIDPGLNTQTGDITMQGILTGSTVFRKNGAGSVRLDGTGSSTNTGSFDVRNGSLILAGANNRLGTGSNVILGNSTNNGLLRLEGVNQTLTALTTAGTGVENRVVGGSATLSTLTINNASASTLAATIGGTGTNHNNIALTKSGAGVLTLSGTNTFTGGTTLSGGLLEIGSLGALGTTGTITMSGGGLRFTATNTTDYSSRIALTDGTTSTFDTNGQNLTFASGFTLGTLQTGGFIKTGAGQLTVNSGAWKGATTVSGGTLEVVAKTNDVAYTINQGATLRLGYTTGGGYANTNLKINGDGASATTGLYLAGGTTYNGSGTIELLTAPTTIRQYGTGLAGIGTFDINGNGMTVVAAASGSQIDANIEMISRGFGMSVNVESGTANATGDLTINGRLNVGNLGFYKRGAGSVLLNQAATTSNAAVRIIGGSIIAGAANVLGANAELPISAGASLRMNGFDQSARNLSGAGSVVNGSSTTTTLTISSTANTTFSGTLGGTGTNHNSLGLTKTGGSTLTLSGSSTFTGPTLVSAGTLLVTGALTDSDVTVAAGATIGGTGTIGGDLGLNGDSFFQIASLTSALTVNGNITFGSGFGIDNLVGVDWDTVDLETAYTLISTTQTFSESSIGNFGLANAAPVGTGRFAYFENGSLRVVVTAVPETHSLLLGLAGMVLVLRRRR